MDEAQDYYWTPEWQADEQVAVQELAEGQGVTFSDAASALEWLSS